MPAQRFTDPRLASLNVDDSHFVDTGMRDALQAALGPGETAIASYSVSAHIWVTAVLTDRALLIVKGAVRARVRRIELPVAVTRAPRDHRQGVRVETPYGRKTLWGSKQDPDARLLIAAKGSTHRTDRAMLAEEPVADAELAEIARLEREEGAERQKEDAALEAEVARLEEESEAEFQKEQAELQAEIDRLSAAMNAERTNRVTRSQAAPAAKRAGGPAAGAVMVLRKVPTYSRIRVIDWGSIEEVDDEVSFTVDDVVTLWTNCVEPDNTFAAVELRGVLGKSTDLQWLPDDAQVEIVALPRFAGQPDDLVRGLKPVPAPAGSRGVVTTSDGFHPLVWNCDPIYSPVQGWDDPETSVEVILCALNVAPEDDFLRTQLLAALRARYSRVAKDEDTYPPSRYPWRGTLEPNRHLLKYLRG